MAPIESLTVTVSGPARRGVPERDNPWVAVWLRGEHDHSTVAELSEALARAITLDDDVGADVVVDLSDVLFMGVATVGVLRRARDLLRARSRRLVLRSPPSCVSRVLELCGDADLLVPAAQAPVTAAAGALGTWVPAPATDRAASASPATPARAPATAGAGPAPDAPVSAVVGDHQPEDLTAAVAGREAP